MRVLVVDDHPVTRDGVRAGLDGFGTAVSEAGDAETARNAVLADRPDVVLVDLRLGVDDGVDFVHYLAGNHPLIRILVLSQCPLADVVRAIRAGAHGYVSKSATSAQLRSAVTGVLAGPRERDVLRALARGYDNREIAGELAIAVRTVNRHLESIRDKLGTRRRSELVRIARDGHG
jgi:DNA-binding NarL/FixJ family response regulator